MGVKRGHRWWDHGELRRLKEMCQRRAGIAEMARALGRSEGSVRNAAQRHGFVRANILPKFTTKKAAPLKARIRQLNRMGRSDREIAEALGAPKLTVWLWRRRLGLPANAAFGQPGRHRIDRALFKKARAAGYENWGTYMRTRYRLDRMREAPRCYSRCSVQLALALLKLGASTVREVEASGLCTVGYYSLVRAVGMLRRDGLLEVRGRRSGRPDHVIDLTPEYRRQLASHVNRNDD